VCAFIRLAASGSDSGEELLTANGCHILARFGDIFIASVPLHKLASLSLHPRVLRIEAERGTQSLTDSVPLQVNALPAYAGTQLPQAFTGAGTVVGVMDIGFDLTHPNFYDASATTYRIRRFWDQLSTDTLGSSLYVGADYTTQGSLLAYAHSRDGLDQTHGTHTAGIAAGSGYDSPYRGLAWGSDLCLVSNAVSADVALIDTADYYKYTYATDALGFKYIFDYAQSVGKPCVINFSEGSPQDFRGDDQLYYTILDSLTGPGRIIVSAAGNTGALNNYIRKPVGMARAGSFLTATNGYLMHTIKSADNFTTRLTFYVPGQAPTVCDIASADVLAAQDSTWTTTLVLGGDSCVVMLMAYKSGYEPSDIVYDLYVDGPKTLGDGLPLSVALMGEAADVALYRVSGYLVTSSLDATLADGDASHGILSPASAPGVICVGATSYRDHVVNYHGEVKQYDQGHLGERGPYSSMGPTYDGRVKPDVMAPGTNIISSYSSYYLEHHPSANDIDWDVKHFDFNGRTYAWNSNSGTSMASPVVAGAIALWLEADPRLTAADCLDIFARTCTRPDASLTYPNNLYGYGQIDVYAGLLEVLRRSSTGLSSVFATPKVSGLSCQVTPTHLVLTAAQPADAAFDVAVYSLQGTLMQQAHFPPGASVYQMPITSLPIGTYAVKVSGSSNISGGLVFARK
jgi:subtilisin family serine protease